MEEHTMTTNLRQRAGIEADAGTGGARSTRMITAPRVAALIEGLAVAVLVGVNGSLPWQLARVLIVGALTALALWGLGSPRRGIRAVVALSAGLIGTIVGIGIGIGHITHDTVNATAVAGVVSLASGLFLLGVGSAASVRVLPAWWKLASIPLALALLLFVLYPLPNALYATNVPRPAVGDATPADRGFTYLDAEFATSDGVTLSGWYVPSTNGAAVVLLHGASSTRSAVLDHAAVLARHGYGVLLFDARGHGRSGGQAMEFGWFGNQDIAAALSYLQARPEVDPQRLGAVGISMGGEQAVGAVATDARIRAVVGEGVTGRTAADKGWLPQHWRGWIQRGIDAVLYGTADLLTETSPPIRLRDAVAQAAPRPVLLIAGGAVMGNAEVDADTWIRAASPDTVQVWIVPDTGHTAALRTQPQQWEAKVIGFLDAALLQTTG
jgi:dienelactone hydrolase